MDNNNDLKKFLNRFALFVIILIIIDFLIGGIFKYYYFKQKSGILYRTTYTIDSTRANLLVFGSSRATHHYVPSVFENNLHTTFYNCGRDGCNLIYYAAVISAVLERHTPKHIIIDLTPDELDFSEEGRLSPLLPYYENSAVYNYIKYNSKFENWKLLSKMYPFNSIFTTIVIGNLTINKSRILEDKGYVKLENTMSFHPIKPFKHGQIIDSRVKVLNELLAKLNKKHIAVTLVVSPSYFSYSKNDPVIVAIQKLIAKHNNIHFLNYENDPAFAQYQLYSDDDHLNEVGAQKFSQDLINKVFIRN
ncbi:MAG: hypothetical protein ACRYFA_05260 [Janthinobacterium lividum]